MAGQPAHTTTRETANADSEATVGMRGIALALGVGVLALGGAVFALLRKRNPAEHAAPDLALGAPPPGTDRAPVAFRPDPTSVPTRGEYDSLRPATFPAPSMVQGEPGLDGPTATG